MGKSYFDLFSRFKLNKLLFQLCVNNKTTKTNKQYYGGVMLPSGMIRMRSASINIWSIRQKMGEKDFDFLNVTGPKCIILIRETRNI